MTVGALYERLFFVESTPDVHMRTVKRANPAGWTVSCLDDMATPQRLRWLFTEYLI
jgi:hypothetical protein